MKKEELIQTAQALGVQLTGEETNDQLKELIEAANDPCDAVVVVRKQNRGTMRRVRNATDKFEAACREFAAEMDRQLHEVDDDGKNVGPWPGSARVRGFSEEVTAEVRALMART